MATIFIIGLISIIRKRSIECNKHRQHTKKKVNNSESKSKTV